MGCDWRGEAPAQLVQSPEDYHQSVLRWHGVLTLHVSGVYLLNLSLQSSRLLSGSLDGFVKMYDVQSYNVMQCLILPALLTILDAGYIFLEDVGTSDGSGYGA